MHGVLKVLEVVTHQVGNDTILFHQLVLQLLIMTLQGKELLLEGLDPAKLFGLHDHHVVSVVHPVSLGVRGHETSDYMLRTLRALVE